MPQMQRRTTLKETNMNAYFSRKRKYVGITMFAATNAQDAVDVNKDGFSDVPAIHSYLFHPRLFLYLDKSLKLSAC